jgi:uncharacterized protein HemY
VNPQITPQEFELLESLLHDARALRDKDEHKAAAIKLRQVVKLAPEAPAFWTMLGDSLAEDGQYADAETAFQMALELKPSHISAHLAKASMFSSQGYLVKAEQCVREALEIDPKHELALAAMQDLRSKGYID